MRKVIQSFRFFSTYVRLVRDSGRLDLVFALADGLDDSPALLAMLAQPAVRTFMARPHVPFSCELAALRAMPPGSLGHSFANFLDDRGLDPKALYVHEIDERSELERFKQHMERTHDLWHTVLGFGTDVAGELGLQAFTTAQLGVPLAHLLISAGMLNAVVFAPEDGDRRLAEIARGWQLGTQVRPLFGADWAAMLAWPLDQVRAHFGVTAGEATTGKAAA